MFGLIVRRELRERLSSSGFWVSTWLSLAAVVIALAAPSLTRTKSAPLRLAAVGSVDATTQRRLLTLVTPPDALDTATLTTIATETEARAALRAKQVDIVVVNTDKVITLDPVDRSASNRQATLVFAVEQVLASANALQGAGLNQTAIDKIANALDTVTIEAVTSSTAIVDKGGRRTSAAIGVALTTILSIVYGLWMLDGVVEERSTRVAELLLTAVRPRQLLRGKVAGIGVVAVAQGLLLTATALGASATISSTSPLRDDKLFVLAVFGWFLLGYACYASAFALIAACSRRHADALGAAFLALAPLLGAGTIAARVLAGQRADGPLRLLSVLPFTSPVAMPARQALGPVPAVQIIVAAVALVAVAAFLISIAGRAYGRTVLDPTRSLFRAARRTRPDQVRSADSGLVRSD